MQVKIPIQKPDIIDTLPVSATNFDVFSNTGPTILSFQNAIDSFFWWCVEILKVWGDVTGLGYNLINILIFILLQPALILLFFTLWIYEKNKKKGVSYG